MPSGAFLLQSAWAEIHGSVGVDVHVEELRYPNVSIYGLG